MLTAQQARELAERNQFAPLEDVLKWIEHRANKGYFVSHYDKAELSIETIEDLKIAGFIIIETEENFIIKW